MFCFFLFFKVGSTKAEAPLIETGTHIDSVLESVREIPTVRKNRTTDCTEYRHLVEQYDWNVDLMLEVMRLESSCNPNAVGDNYHIRGVLAPSCGLMQIRTLQGRPDCETLKDPQTNIDWAYKIYKEQGIRAWSVTHNW